MTPEEVRELVTAVHVRIALEAPPTVFFDNPLTTCREYWYDGKLKRAIPADEAGQWMTEPNPWICRGDKVIPY